MIFCDLFSKVIRFSLILVTHEEYKILFSADEADPDKSQ